MPELPEVETIRRQLAPRITGAEIVGAEAHESPKFAPAVEAIGFEVTGVDRRGKYLLIGLTNGDSSATTHDQSTHELIVHLGMTGGLSVVDKPTGDAYLRAAWDFHDGRRLEFRDVRRFGRLRVVPAGDYETIATLRDLGPEPFDDAFTGEHLFRALNASSRRIKTQLLSQRPVAGVGNIYADEALWRAQVYPAARRVTRRQAVKLRDAVEEVLAAGVRNGGTTLRDYRTVSGDKGSNQFHLECYGRAGHPCGRCGAELRSRVWDARTTTFCPECQPR